MAERFFSFSRTLCVGAFCCLVAVAAGCRLSAVAVAAIRRRQQAVVVASPLRAFERCVFGGVVWCFLSDSDVMGMVLPNRSGRDSNESSVGPQFVDCVNAHVSHTGTKSADELVKKPVERPLVGNASFDSFGNEFGV